MARGIHKCDYKKFLEAFNAFAVEGKSLAEAQRICGMHRETMIKYFEYVLSNKPLPAGLFFDEKGRFYTEEEIREDEKRREVIRCKKQKKRMEKKKA